MGSGMLLLGMLGLGHTMRSSSSSSPSSSSVTVGDHANFGEPEWWIACGISVFLVVFAGVMSGLTLGLMSLGLVDLEVLQQSGTVEEKKRACEFTYIPPPFFLDFFVFVNSGKAFEFDGF